MKLTNIRYSGTGENHVSESPRQKIRMIFMSLVLFLPALILKLFFSKGLSENGKRQERAFARLFPDFEQWIDDGIVIWPFEVNLEVNHRQDVNSFRLQKITEPQKLELFRQLWFGGRELWHAFAAIQRCEDLESLRICFSDQDLLFYLFNLMALRHPEMNTADLKDLVKEELKAAGISEARFYHAFHSDIDYAITVDIFRKAMTM